MPVLAVELAAHVAAVEMVQSGSELCGWRRAGRFRLPFVFGRRALLLREVEHWTWEEALSLDPVPGLRRALVAETVFAGQSQKD